MRLFLLLAAQIDPQKVVEPSLSTLDKTVIGSLLILSWVLTIALVVQLIRVQNARVADQQMLSDKSEKLMDKMLTAFTEMKAALESLKEAEKSSQQASEALRNVIDGLRRSFDMFLIAQGYRKFTPPSGLSKADIIKAQEELERKKREGG
jgi:hypothetical protein